MAIRNEPIPRCERNRDCHLSREWRALPPHGGLSYDSFWDSSRTRMKPERVLQVVASGGSAGQPTTAA